MFVASETDRDLGYVPRGSDGHQRRLEREHFPPVPYLQPESKYTVVNGTTRHRIPAV